MYNYLLHHNKRKQSNVFWHIFMLFDSSVVSVLKKHVPVANPLNYITSMPRMWYSSKRIRPATRVMSHMDNTTLSHIFQPMLWQHSSYLKIVLELAGTWKRRQMETFSVLLAICAGNSPAPGEFPAQRPVKRRLNIFFHLRLNKRLSKQSRGW